ncbi:MAG: hypothetical protein Q4A33_02345 [Candidatus Saccharibacteria bacterium]|nr:hypothetical protein [Candidatus Saccharibacteria bacterium]
MDSLYNSILGELTSTGNGGFDANTSWKICTIVLCALGTAALFIFFTYFKKGAEKRKPADDIKNFFLFKGNFAEDLARICFYYVSLQYVMDGLKTLTTGGDPWGFFSLIFHLVFIRFVYEAALTIIRFCKSNTKKD